jgi:hypothetical protein
MLRRVALVRTDVSEELSASFIRVTRIRELWTELAVTSNRRNLRRNTSVISVIHVLKTTWTEGLCPATQARTLHSAYIKHVSTLSQAARWCLSIRTMSLHDYQVQYKSHFNRVPPATSDWPWGTVLQPWTRSMNVMVRKFSAIITRSIMLLNNSLSIRHSDVTGIPQSRTIQTLICATMFSFVFLKDRHQVLFRPRTERSISVSGTHLC